MLSFFNFLIITASAQPWWISLQALLAPTQPFCGVCSAVWIYSAYGKSFTQRWAAFAAFLIKNGQDLSFIDSAFHLTTSSPLHLAHTEWTIILPTSFKLLFHHCPLPSLFSATLEERTEVHFGVCEPASCPFLLLISWFLSVFSESERWARAP